MTRHAFFKWLLAAASVLASVAQAQTKPVEWVIGYPAGGGSDIVARTIADEIGKQLNRPVVVNNKPGAGTVIGTAEAAKAVDMALAEKRGMEANDQAALMPNNATQPMK